VQWRGIYWEGDESFYGEFIGKLTTTVSWEYLVGLGQGSPAAHGVEQSLLALSTRGPRARSWVYLRMSSLESHFNPTTPDSGKPILLVA
jgi:hypothetical protein